MQTIGREKEIQYFNEILAVENTTAQFIGIYGRRRIGKTFLVRSFFQSRGLYFEITGEKDANCSHQLQNFHAAYNEAFHEHDQSIPKSWKEAFLKTYKKFGDIKQKNKKKIFFIDEIPWLDTQRSDFISALDHYWNKYFSQIPNLILIICGSNASWMIKNVIYSPDGLHKRLTKTIKMSPFNWNEYISLLHSKSVQLNLAQAIELYMALGGIPKYLEQIKSGESSSQIIENFYFHNEGKKEFQILFKALFKNYELYQKVMALLCKHRYGLTQEEIIKKLSISSGGRLSLILENLKNSDFVDFYQSYQKKKKSGIYRVVDEFCLFHQYWENLQVTRDPNPWLKIQNSSQYWVWNGLAFEIFCLKNIEFIKLKLGISALLCAVSTWQNEKAQIDLIIERSDRSLHLIEIKTSNHQLKINDKFMKNMETKRNEFLAETEYKGQVFLTLITQCEVAYDKKTQGRLDQIINLAATLPN